MSYKTFVNGFPLNASELNEYLMSQVIAVFVDATARDAAIETPGEGQFAYLTGSNTLTLFNGTAWENYGLPALTANRAVATDGSGSLTASTVTATELGYLSGVTSSIQTQINAIPGGGMVKVGATSFSGASSVPVNNVFSSTYQNYKIFIELALNSGAAGGGFRFRTSGTDNSTSTYSQQVLNVFGTSTAQSRTSGTQFSSLFDIASSGSSAELTIFNPFAAKKTYVHAHSMYDANNVELQFRSAVFNATTSFDGFTLLPASGTLTGTLKVYGLVD